MIGNTRRKRGWPIALLALAVVLATRAAPAQDEEEEDEEAPVAAAVAAPNAFVLSEPQFNAWVFGNSGGTTDSIQSKMRSIVNVQVAEMQQVCGLTETQKAKLQLTGRGDLKRFFDRVEDLRRKYQGKSFAQNQINEIYQKLQPLQQSFNSGLLEGDALFAKVATRLLDTQQKERYEEVKRERRAYQYAVQADLVIIIISRSMGLSASQQKQLVELILRETRTPRRLGQNPQSAVYVEMSRIPEEKLRPIFDEAQWPLMQQYLQNGKAMQQFLKQNGYVPAEEDEGDTEPKDKAKRVVP